MRPAPVRYLSAAHRRRRRYKVRIRSYLDSDLRFLEVKTWGRRGATVKHRIPYAGSDLVLGSEARAHTYRVLAAAGIHSRALPFRYALTTCYRRTTLYVPSAGRVTVDTGLTWVLPSGATVRMPDRAIVEAKSARLTSAVDRLLWSQSHRPCSVSKYDTGLAALRPELPANRWQPVLRRHFSTTNEC